VSAGAYHVEVGHGAFAAGTIHVVVVDPGVGTNRRAVAVETVHHVFLAPDNGVLSRVLARGRPVRAHTIDNPRYVAPLRSTTFHGRDVFAPAAAWVARGVPLAELGPPAGDLVALERCPAPIASASAVEVPVVIVDRFGNVVLDLRAEEIERAASGDAPWHASFRVVTPDGSEARYGSTYAAGLPGETFYLVNSAGYVELARRDASAAAATGLRPGDRVPVRIG